MVNKKLTIPELKKMCEENNLEFNNKFKKNDYIKLLSENNISLHKNQINLENDVSQNDESQTNESQTNDSQTNDSQNEELENNESQNEELENNELENEELENNELENEELENNESQNDESQNEELENNGSQNDELEKEDLEKEELQNNELEKEDLEKEELQNDESQNDDSQNNSNEIEENKQDIIFLKQMVIKLSKEVDYLKKMFELSNSDNILDENILKEDLNDELSNDESLKDDLLKEDSLKDDSLRDDSLNDDILNSSNKYNILNNKEHLDNEVVELGNSIYSLGLRFQKVLDTNCLDNNFIKFLLERGYKCKGLNLNDKQLDNCEKTDINISHIEDNCYDIVFCINLFQYLEEEDIKLYYKNLIRISSEFVIIKIGIKNENKSESEINNYLNYFNDVVSNQEKYKINRYITEKLPKNIFILKKELIN